MSAWLALVALVAEVSVERLAILDTSGFALGVTGSSRLHGIHLSAIGTIGGLDRACLVAANAVIDLARTRLEPCATLPVDGGDYGRGIEIAAGAIAHLERVRIERVNDHALLAVDRADVTLSDAVIADVAPRACTTPECEAHPAGFGIGVYGAQLAVDQFTLERASSCGAHRAADATLVLNDGLVAENDATALNASELPVPQVVLPVELE